MHIHRGGGAGLTQKRWVASDLLLDLYPDASVAFSLRKLRNAYAGSALRLRRESDDAETDIGFDSSGNFDAAAAASHIGASVGRVVTWYDQSGAGLDVTHATEANQPLYVASGINSLPTMDFDGTADHLSRATVPNTAFAPGTQFTCLAVCNQSSDTSQALLSWEVASTNRILMINDFGNAMRADYGNDTDTEAGGLYSVSNSADGLDTGDHILEYYRDSSNVQGLVKDGTSVGTATRNADIAAADGTLSIGQVVSALFHDGNLSEIVFWGTDLGSTDRAAARDHMNAYYSVF
jgi:hypothetical protein